MVLHFHRDAVCNRGSLERDRAAGSPRERKERVALDVKKKVSHTLADCTIVYNTKRFYLGARD